ncbi:glycerol dehydrogenase [Georgenia sp. TF02-10]|uniref:glycerol dehydrogenase n=1 Tax=Georgenia sp. TF02-10 TaxID=2917725 RepID=UPI001FA6E876|nr:glycerol dehydrogenase [Georgenia sp. TF02-10]UNX54822.1 glycerol dehydrogenase [Georgenia sp. TF02-10]
MPNEIRSLIAPARYVQGRGAMARLGEFLKQIGSTPLLVADDEVWGFAGEAVTASLEAAGLPVNRERFAGYATAATIDRLTEATRSAGADVVVGVGGGSTIDAVKAAGHLAGVRWASVPTVASTDAPCSALSVVYREDGSMEEYRFFPHNPDLVLVDSQLVANAPVRFLIAGVGDALATWPEARAVAAASSATMAGGLPTVSGTALARLSWDILHEYALPAIAAVRDHLVTPAVEKVIEANTLLSGLGFESGGLAAAHAIHDGLTAVPNTHGLTHGEKVNVGTLTQLVLEGAPAQEVHDFITFTTRVGLPNTLTEVGLAVDAKDALRTVATAATAEEETIHAMPFEVTVTDLVDALASIEGLSRSVRREAGLAEPRPFVQH